MSEITLVLKTDVDTLTGYREGVPCLLEIFRQRRISSSIFFSFGPDNSGKALRRIFRRGFVRKMIRTRAPSTYGLRTLLYGTLLPAPPIIPTEPGIFLRALDEGHDCGVHCWDHVKWQDCLPRLSREEIREDFRKAFDLFDEYSGRRAKSCAAPGWQVTPDSLAVQDELNLDYCSDTRGQGFPFLPRMGKTTFKTLQIPTTLPTLDEIYGREDLPREKISEYYLSLLKPGLNVHTIHAEMEGRGQAGLFEDLLDRCLEKGVEFRTLSDIALGQTLGKSLPHICAVEPGTLEGRSGTVALQRCSREEEKA